MTRVMTLRLLPMTWSLITGPSVAIVCTVGLIPDIVGGGFAAVWATAADVIVSAPDSLADIESPSSTTTSHGAPGGVVAGLTAISHVTLFGFEATFVAAI